MSPNVLKEWGPIVFIGLVCLKWAFAELSSYRNGGEKREEKTQSHITQQHSQADGLIADLLRAASAAGREDYLRLEAKFDILRGDVHEALIVNTRLREELSAGARRDVEFYDRQLPALLKRAMSRDNRIDNLHDSLNQVRSHLGMPLLNQTPWDGVKVSASVPTHIDDTGSGSPLDAVKGTKG